MYSTQDIILMQLKTGSQSLGQLVAYAPATDHPHDEKSVVNALDLLIMLGKVVLAKLGERKEHFIFGNTGPKRDLANSIDARGVKVYRLA